MHCNEIYCVVAGMISVLGLVGNGIVFRKFGKMYIQNASTFLFRALACVDSFLLIVCLLGHTLAILESGSFWMLATSVYIMEPLTEIARTATIWTILLVGVHRYIVVCKPLMAARLCTVSNARRHFLGVIIFVLAANFPLFFRYRVTERHVTSNRMDYNVTYAYVVGTDMRHSPWFKFLYDLAFRYIIVNYVIPVGSLIYITVRLLQSLHPFKQRRMALSECQRHVQRVISSECMVIVVLIVFLLCHTSLPIALELHRLEKLWALDTPYCKTMFFSAFALSYSLILHNSSTNIIIYVVFNRKFRRTLCPCLKSVTSGPTTLIHWISTTD